MGSKGFFEQLDKAMEQVLQQARRQGVNVADIEGVLLVGGTSQIPAVQDWLKGYFDDSKIRSDRPFEAIAQGALQLAQGIHKASYLLFRKALSLRLAHRDAPPGIAEFLESFRSEAGLTLPDPATPTALLQESGFDDRR